MKKQQLDDNTLNHLSKATKAITTIMSLGIFQVDPRTGIKFTQPLQAYKDIYTDISQCNQKLQVGVWTGKRSINQSGFQLQLIGRIHVSHMCVMIDGQMFDFTDDINKGGYITAEIKTGRVKDFDWQYHGPSMINQIELTDALDKFNQLKCQYKLIGNNCQDFSLEFSKYAMQKITLEDFLDNFRKYQ